MTEEKAGPAFVEGSIGALGIGAVAHQGAGNIKAEEDTTVRILQEFAAPSQSDIDIPMANRLKCVAYRHCARSAGDSISHVGARKSEF